jgi:hypothetical protein
MALTSPGVEISIIDESQYIPAATNSVPYILLATAQNKVSGAGVGVAAGTLQANANRVYLITSQRDLSATYGVPFFYKTTAGTPINGYELNEYGLLAAYSALGVSNRAYIQRVDIDLAELTATLVRPTGSPNEGTYWFDTKDTQWGIFQWNQVTAAFTNEIPSVIDDTAYLESNSTVPVQSFGNIGDYAAVVTTSHNPVYYKRGGPTSAQAPGYLQDGMSADELYNTWVLIGSNEWKTAWPTISGTLAPTTLTNNTAIEINGTPISITTGNSNLTVLGLATYINNAGITGVYAAAIGGKLVLYASGLATNDGSTNGTGIININNLTGTPLTTLGITSGQYNAPDYQHSPSYQAPRWRTTDNSARPTGSVWNKTNNVNLGTNIVVKKYNSTLGAFVQQPATCYQSDNDADYTLSPTGAKYIPAGTTYTRPDPENSSSCMFEIRERYQAGALNVTGTVKDPSFTPGDAFLIQAGQPGTTQNYPTVGSGVVVAITGVSAAEFCASVSAANVPYVSCSVNSAGYLVFTNSSGGNINLKPIAGRGNPIDDAGFNTSIINVREQYTPPYGTVNGVVLSNWITAPDFVYTASNTTPGQDPASGRLWYYSATDQADIMIQQYGSWLGYQNCINSVRGENLTLTNATGPIFSATAPTTQTDDAMSPLVPGDLWVDTATLEGYPMLYRWTLNDNGVGEWIELDDTDQTTENGILFADARWAPDGNTNPITDPIPPITGSGGLITSNYLDLDAPNPNLYPQGMLLWNTRRSGFNVKKFEAGYFNSMDFSVPLYDPTTYYNRNSFVIYNGLIYVSTLPTTGNAPTDTEYWAEINTNTWVNAAGNKADGSPYMGRLSQRALIVDALKAGIDTSTSIREEQRQFNLIACPQYPELTPNMVALNNERNDTAFVIADTPLRLTPEEIVNFATNNDGLGLATEDGLTTGNAYCGAFYPSCQTTDLSGSTVVQPPSHMMIRTIIRSDEVGYPWLAPAGTRRGVIDNATRIGYINSTTGEFEAIGVNQGIRDVLYENRINPITFVPGVGITNFGNKTVTQISSALNRINVARLVAFIRARLEVIAKTFLFEPNDQITRNEITNVITSLMIDLIAKRGIYDYLVVCDLTNNTPARIDRNELYVDIAIEPVKAVEFIYIPIRIKNTGEIASQSV